jgi:hypothetical protein
MSERAGEVVSEMALPGCDFCVNLIEHGMTPEDARRYHAEASKYPTVPGFVWPGRWLVSYRRNRAQWQRYGRTA